MQLKQQVRQIERWSFAACVIILAAIMSMGFASAPDAEVMNAGINVFIVSMLVHVAAKFIRGFMPESIKNGQ